MVDCAWIQCAGVLFAALAAGVGKYAVEYFVSLSGDDANDGLRPTTPFATIQRGVDALAPGDTLTIAPGEYTGAVFRKGLGSPDAETRICAELPGTVLLRGDVPAPDFEPVDGYCFVYAADFDGPVEAVAERDTLATLDKLPNVADLEFSPGACHYDAEAKRLYISTSDLQPPPAHYYTVMVIPESGLRLENPTRVTVEGLSATGFYRSGQLSLNFGQDYIWGIVLTEPKDCAVRECIAFMNGGGISLFKGEANVIERCLVYGNSNRYASEGGGIIRFFGKNDVIRDCFAYNSKNAGVRFYSTMTGPSILRNNLSWGNAKGDFWIKGGGAEEHGLAEGCVSGGTFNVLNVKNCLLGGPNSYRRELGIPPDSVELPNLSGELERHFADPANFDFRLQSASSLRATGPNGSDPGPRQYSADVFYVSPDGDDANEGTAAELAWKSLARALERLRPGDTLYLMPGTHSGPVTVAARDVTIRGRGAEPVSVHGSFTLKDCERATIERLAFAGQCIVVGGSEVTFKNCVFSDAQAEGSRSLRIEHNVFWGAPRFRKCADLFLRGNIFAAGGELADSQATYSDYNAYPDKAFLERMPDRYGRVAKPEPDSLEKVSVPRNNHAFAGRGPNGTSIGPYREFPERQARLVGPFVYSVTDTTANIEWWTSLPSRCELAWGTTPDCENALTREVNGFGTHSLIGLEPGRKHYFKIRSVAPVKELDHQHTKSLSPDNSLASFTTLAEAPTPATYHVATNGDDNADGLSRATAWRSIQRAANSVDPGDTVLVGGGRYRETVLMRASGKEGRPILFRAAPGEKVVFDAGKRELTNAFIVNGKRFLAFDGFYFFGFNAAGNDAVKWVPGTAGVFQICDSADIVVTRCLMNGMGGGYCCPFIVAGDSARLRMENCVVTGGFSGLQFYNCPDTRLEHNAVFRNYIQQMIVENEPDEKFFLTRNVFGDSLPRKAGVQMFEAPWVESLVEEDNCYYLRMPDEKRRMFLFYRNEEFGKGIFDRRLSLAAYKERVNPSTDSIVADPKFRVVPELNVSGVRDPGYFGDRIVSSRQLDLDFNDVFATDPEVLRLGAGLQPEAFEDFHFNCGGH